MSILLGQESKQIALNEDMVTLFFNVFEKKMRKVILEYVSLEDGDLHIATMLKKRLLLQHTKIILSANAGILQAKNAADGINDLAAQTLALLISKDVDEELLRKSGDYFPSRFFESVKRDETSDLLALDALLQFSDGLALYHFENPRFFVNALYSLAQDVDAKNAESEFREIYAAVAEEVKERVVTQLAAAYKIPANAPKGRFLQ